MTAEAIVLLAHGSRDDEGTSEFLTFANRLSSRLAVPIYPGFLELSDPPVVSAIDTAVQTGAKTILAVPWFLLGAGHAKNDLPVAIQWARQHHPQTTIHYGTPINVQPTLLSVLADRLAAIDPDHGTGSAETVVLLVQRGSSDPDANAEVYRAARLLWEGRRYCAVEVAFSGITSPSIEQGLQRCLAHNTSRILVVPYFLYTGAVVKRLSTIVAEVAAAHPECTFHVAQHLGQDTRLEILAQQMIEQLRNGKATMNCDLCQYRVPLFGRESRVGMPQVSDHAHGLRGTMMSDHTHAHEDHYHDDHHDGHTHEHRHSHNTSSDPWKALRECVTAAGILNMQEATDALTAWQSKRRTQTDAPPPYILTAIPGHGPTAALRWDWDSRRAHEFATWCMTVLLERFDITWHIDYEDENPPHYLCMTLGEQQERCDWHYLNQNHWMGAFCTIADRLLASVGVTALSLETGWFDTVVVFCRSSHAEEILRWFPEAE